jgi:hypothetical protein
LVVSDLCILDGEEAASWWNLPYSTAGYGFYQASPGMREKTKILFLLTKNVLKFYSITVHSFERLGGGGGGVNKNKK